MNYEELRELALNTGFTHTVPLDISTIELKQEVRDMCKQGCQQYPVFFLWDKSFNVVTS